MEKGIELLFGKNLVYVIKEKELQMELVRKCIENSISFEYLNGEEFFFHIYDYNDYSIKRYILGEEIINIKNLVK